MTGMVCRITGAGAERDLTAQLSFSRPLDGAAVIVEGSETVWITKTESHVPNEVFRIKESSKPSNVSSKSKSSGKSVNVLVAEAFVEKMNNLGTSRADTQKYDELNLR